MAKKPGKKKVGLSKTPQKSDRVSPARLKKAKEGAASTAKELARRKAARKAHQLKVNKKSKSKKKKG